MHEQHWGCGRNPFAGGSSPDYFFPSSSQQSALLKLHYAVEHRLGAALLAGLSGTGKSCTIARLFAELPDEFHPHLHLLYPQMTSRELLSWIARQLDAAAAGDDGDNPGRRLRRPDEDRLDVILDRVEASLLQLAASGRSPVIVIDEAHLIDDPQVFQSLRLLLNYREQRQLEFTLLLVGEPILIGQVSRLSQLDERLALRCVLQPMSRDEVERYVACRLEAAGASQPVFDGRAMQSLFELSGGNARRVNRLCDLSMLVACAGGRHRISAEDVEAVGAELLALT